MRGKKFKEVFTEEFIEMVHTCTGLDMITVTVINGKDFDVKDLTLVDREAYKKYLDMKITEWLIFGGVMKVYIKED